MAGETCCRLIKDKQQIYSSKSKPHQESQYANFNLNLQNHDGPVVHSKSISFDNKKGHKNGKIAKAAILYAAIYCYCVTVSGKKCYQIRIAASHNSPDIFYNDSKSISQTKNQWHKMPRSLSSDFFNPQNSEKVLKKPKNDSNQTSSSSTLSLHIAAYENGIQVDQVAADGSNENGKVSFDKTLKNVKQLISQAAFESTFEIPRQQKDESTKPEVMQFKASQKLLNPNQQNSSSGKDASESKFEELKQKANKLFKAENYKEAIKIYDHALKIPKLTSENKAILYSNKSAANLMLKDETSLMKAKKDAEEAIKLMPTWWRGYFRLGRVQAASEELRAAEKTFEKALALNSESKEIRDELGAVRGQIGIRSRQDTLDPTLYPPSMEEQLNEVCSRLGISKAEAKKLLNSALKNPVLSNVLQGNAYRDGDGVEKNLAKAAEFYAKAAEKGNPDAMYNLGKMYNYGEGVQRDFDKSMFWLMKAANSTSPVMIGSGIPEAQHSIGLKYTEGVGVEKDYRKAAEWYEKAIKNGSSRSANNLGLLYKDGLGVEKSGEKAFQYFKHAIQESGYTAAMMNLADCYFEAIGTGSTVATDEDIAEGMKWLKTAADKGDLKAAKEYQRRQNLEPEEAAFDMLNSFFMPDINDPLNYEQHGRYVKEAASKGSLTAQRNLNIWRNLNKAIEAFKKKDSAELVAALAKAIRFCYDIVNVPDLLKPVINQRFKTHPNDLDTAVCYIHINTKNPIITRLSKKYNKMFPDDIYLWEMVIASNITFEKDVDAALKTVKLALKRHPNSHLMLYSYAILLDLEGNPRNGCIEAFDAYLAIAAEDNEKVPACHYRKAQNFITLMDFPNAIASIEAGKAAEKKQLACFLPYYFSSKPMLEKFFMLHKSKVTPSPQAAVVNPRLVQIQNDSRRKMLTLKHRQTFVACVKDYGTLRLSMAKTVTNVPQEQNPPNWSSSTKKITIRDIDSSKDKLYGGYILEGRIIDWGFLMNSIATNFEDENGEIYRLAIHNWSLPELRDPAILETLKVLRPNVKISILNPYHRQGIDGHNHIRVEGPEFIKLDTSMIDKLCHVCGKEGSSLPTCNGCKMALYCSKECQKHDWTEFNHKEICKYLKMFKPLM